MNVIANTKSIVPPNESAQERELINSMKRGSRRIETRQSLRDFSLFNAWQTPDQFTSRRSA